ncbi:hypothetical protein Bbelb_083840 [Branchiostoma belcheri]|nr:hypothetical protein Bbelb_083840 [Branchiostoma belcheri]
MFVSKDECEESRAYLAEKYGKVKAIAGTMSFHAVVGGPGEVKSRSTSCYCEHCFDTDGFKPDTTCEWQTRTISTSTNIVPVELPETPVDAAQIRVRDYVAVLYEKKSIPFMNGLLNEQTQ